MQAASTTPALPCCAQNAGGKRACAPAASDWATPAWRDLQFAMTREFYFQYAYTPGAAGQTFSATATGDLDCDGTMVTYVVNGYVENGQPKLQVIEPPPNAD
jgi:hypothetical protein